MTYNNDKTIIYTGRHVLTWFVKWTDVNVNGMCLKFWSTEVWSFYDPVLLKRDYVYFIYFSTKYHVGILLNMHSIGLGWKLIEILKKDQAWLITLNKTTVSHSVPLFCKNKYEYYIYPSDIFEERSICIAFIFRF